jgi:AraC family transcriptional regulator of adaptative response/methylated-DNA-[protein]-cysteine methyltransferase
MYCSSSNHFRKKWVVLNLGDRYSRKKSSRKKRVKGGNPIMGERVEAVQIHDVQIHDEDYQRIAQAIGFMREHYRDQPDLATIAQQVHLSEYHFQRLFTQWAGISPKRFLQCLTVEYAKAKIAETRNLLDLTHAVGLSSPGRLHDLFVNLEAMSPGEFKTGGVGLTIAYGIHNTPFGKALIATTARGICDFRFLDDLDEQKLECNLSESWKNAAIHFDPDATQELCDRLFDPTKVRSAQPVTVLAKGTNFQIQVWRALLQIPFGGLITYQGIAEMLGRPTAARAVGSAVGKNAIAYIIPCHRVIRESGALGGYRWGLDRKTSMLAWEASHAAS